MPDLFENSGSCCASIVSKGLDNMKKKSASSTTASTQRQVPGSAVVYERVFQLHSRPGSLPETVGMAYPNGRCHVMTDKFALQPERSLAVPLTQHAVEREKQAIVRAVRERHAANPLRSFFLIQESILVVNQQTSSL